MATNKILTDLHIDGNVGIGTDSPNETLGLHKSTRPYIQFTSDSTGTTSGDGSFIGFANNSGFLEIRNKENQPIRLSTNDTEVMRIAADGKVGIGTDSPDNILHVRAGDTGYASQVGADTMLILETTNTSNSLQFSSTTSGNQYIMFGDDDPNAGWIAYAHSDNSLNFRTAGSEKMRITAAGNVGIGTDSPDALLDIGVNNIITLDDTGSSTGFIGMGSYNDGTKNRAQGASYYGFGLEIDRPNELISFNSYDSNGATGGGTDILVLKRDGNVGIGTDSPLDKLTISGGTGDSSSNDAITTLTRISSTGNVLAGKIVLTAPTAHQQNMVFRIKSTASSDENPSYYTDAMTVRYDGNVGIGTTNPSTKLMLEHNNDGAVGGTIRIKDRDTQQSANQLTGAIEFESQDATEPTSGVSTAIKAFAASVTGGSYLTISTTDISTSTLDERMRITAGGDVNIKGNNTKLGWERTSDGASNIVYLTKTQTISTNGEAKLHGYDGIIFTTAGTETERMRIDSAGNSTFAGDLFIGDTTDAKLYMISTGGNGNNARFFIEGYADGGTYGGGFKLSTRNDSNIFNTAVTVNRNGNVTMTGTVSASNLSGTNTGDQDLSTYALAADYLLDTTDTLTGDLTVTGDIQVGAKTSSDSSIISRAGDIQLRIGDNQVAHSPYIRLQGNNGVSSVYGDIKLDTVNGKLVFNDPGTTSGDIGTNPMTLDSSGNLEVAGTVSASNFSGSSSGTNTGDQDLSGYLLNTTDTLAGNLSISGGNIDIFRSAGNHATTRAEALSRAGLVVKSSGSWDSKLTFSSGASSVQYIQALNNAATTGRDIHINPYGGDVISAGTFTGTNFILSSDSRLKDNIKEVDNKSINVDWKTFEMKSDKEQKRYGVIAQELEEAHPEFVRTDDEGMKSVAYIDLLIAKIAELEARLEKAGI